MNGTRPSTDARRGSLRRWLRPGIGIKRWLVVVLAGEVLVALAIAVALRQLDRDLPAGHPLAMVLEVLTLGFLPEEVRPVVLVSLGLVIFAFGVWRLFRALIEPISIREQPLVELLFQRRVRARGPRIVAIGGGTGLSTLLRGLKELTSNITAVVTVADDGGSSGELRRELGVPPMGDIRNCIAALADAEPAMTRLLQYRFPRNGSTPEEVDADSPAREPLVGHAFGNLLIAALADIEGDFEEAVRQSNRVLAVRGNVVPAAPEPVTLVAELSNGRRLEGQSAIARARGISRVWIEPAEVRGCVEAVQAIGEAELIVIGPGSLYTSLLPSLLVPGIRAALETARAPRLYVCNVATQIGETEGFALSDHLAALRAHGLLGLIDAVLVNDNFTARAPHGYPAAPVRIDVPTSNGEPLIVSRDVVDDDNAHHHDPHKLASAVVALYDDGALRALRRGEDASRAETVSA